MKLRFDESEDLVVLFYLIQEFEKIKWFQQTRNEKKPNRKFVNVIFHVDFTNKTFMTHEGEFLQKTDNPKSPKTRFDVLKKVKNPNSKTAIEIKKIH